MFVKLQFTESEFVRVNLGIVSLVFEENEGLCFKFSHRLGLYNSELADEDNPGYASYYVEDDSILTVKKSHPQYQKIKEWMDQ